MYGDGNDTTPSTYTVSFNGNGAESAPSPISDISYGAIINAPTNPIWTGNNFLGWYDSGLTTQYSFPLTITSNITLYAKWLYTAKEVWDYQDFGDYAPTITAKTISSLADFLDANATITTTAGNYVLNITSDVDIGSAYIQPAADSNISLRGGGTLHRSSGTSYPLFYLPNANTKLILRDANLKGNSSNRSALVELGNNSASFIMLGGTISDNNGGNGGGGVYAHYGAFTMKGGTISGNSAGYGGGVYVGSGCAFAKTGGIIYGNNAADASLKNTATSGDGYGHAVYCNGSGGKKRNATAGETINLDCSTSNNWE